MTLHNSKPTIANSVSSVPLTPPIIPPTLRSLLFENGIKLSKITTIEARLAQFESEINEFRRETATNYTIMDQRLDIVGDTIKQLGDAIVLLTQHRRAQIADYRSSLYQQHESLIRKLDVARNSELENAIEHLLDALSERIDEADEQLTEIDRGITSSLATLNHLPQDLTATFPDTSVRTCPPLIIVDPESMLTPKRKQIDQAGIKMSDSTPLHP
ncbi:hypothetical protein IW262DRAFT_1452185 [Armillaria fumosa]|nr:hypothetical protein IW262DRAFT_1452185 [Armillaria fumosa]